MIEIVKEKVEMPKLSERRFQKKCKDDNWSVVDTENNTIAYKGKFEEVCIAWHSLNKKHYR